MLEARNTHNKKGSKRLIKQHHFADGGDVTINNIDAELEAFDIDDLDDFERFQYDDLITGSTKVSLLQVLINNVEGDYSQLSEGLAALAEKQTPQAEWDRWFTENLKYKMDEGGGYQSEWKDIGQGRMKFTKGVFTSTLKKYLINNGGLKEEDFAKHAQGGYSINSGNTVAYEALRKYALHNLQIDGKSNIDAYSTPYAEGGDVSGEKLSDGGDINEGNNTYVAFYRGKDMEVKADTSYQAQLKAAAAFKAKKSYEVSVMLASKGDEEVVHSTSEFAKGGDVKGKYKIKETPAYNQLNERVGDWYSVVDKHGIEQVLKVGNEGNKRNIYEVSSREKAQEWIDNPKSRPTPYKYPPSDFAEGGDVNVIDHAGRYLTVSATKDKMTLTLTPEGRQEIEEMRTDDKSDMEIMYDLFEDIQGNSELMYHSDLGEAGLGLTSASGVTDGYYYDDDNEFVEAEDSRVYYFNDYAIRSEVDDLLEYGELVLTGADNKFAKGGDTDTTFVPNRDVKQLMVMLNKELTNLSGDDITDGVHVKNSVVGTDNKISAPELHAEIIKELKSHKGYDKESVHKIKEEYVQQLIDAGYDKKDIMVILLGIESVYDIKCDNEFTTSVGITGITHFREDAIPDVIKEYVEVAKENKYELGLEYPNFSWDSIVKKYKINPKPIYFDVKSDYGNSYYSYEVYVGEKLVIGHHIKYTGEDGKTDGEQNKLGDITKFKQTPYQKHRDVKAGFNSGYWGVVSSVKENILDVMKTLISQSSGYVKEMEVFTNGIGGARAHKLDPQGIKYEEGGKLYDTIEDSPEFEKGGTVENLEKELHRLQRDLNSSRLGTYIEGDTSEEEKARQRERETKLARFNEVLKLLNER